jgi:alkanesulfonate monooxygenase SsuD/methylene tetrahydromethanopterin reductase-like flavin-dependent oxidoreductase (luciferase family)
MSGHFRRRGRREEEQIEVLRKLWAEPVVDHTDTDHRIERAGIAPLPRRRIPIWLGGFSAPAWNRAARIADGFIISGRSQGEAREVKARIEAKLVELGRGDDAFGFEAIQPLARGPDLWSKDIETWRAAGGTHISVVTMNAGLATVDQHIDAIGAWRWPTPPPSRKIVP